ncbi:protein-L-isoaspartate(D-aspartate) O-methyltransferase [Marinicella sp. S6413]|uniref:protein-L-isoaspartate(D-aspartate) O-methyltransferase n=1 Tax=Marinicella gelatinilytica TaxID=2996017 RepID=UPI002260B2D6|nr:protein-L-isoaspartate(D-aspartate) O-methyltransferase [Marinicella gelatinilytica]MCX7546008.1 protein-L-isoaspartate(D-aspartate) O-methyltransferase [Marinicella gelatinilytica]
MTSQRTRQRMIDRLQQRGINNEQVLQAMNEVPRHVFVDEALAHRAYEDTALPIKFSQTISQPYIVARMTAEVLSHPAPKKVLELGTGSGYQAAVLSRLIPEVFSIERIDKLTRIARRRFINLGYLNIRCKTDDGYLGWPSEAPFDVIIITAAPPEPPLNLLEQLAPGGFMIVPVGGKSRQTLQKISPGKNGPVIEDLGDVIFVPLLEGVER